MQWLTFIERYYRSFVVCLIGMVVILFLSITLVASTSRIKIVSKRVQVKHVVLPRGLPEAPIERPDHLTPPPLPALRPWSCHNYPQWLTENNINRMNDRKVVFKATIQSIKENYVDLKLHRITIRIYG